MDRIATKTHHQQTLAITRAFDNLAKAASHVRWVRYSHWFFLFFAI